MTVKVREQKAFGCIWKMSGDMFKDALSQVMH